MWVKVFQADLLQQLAVQLVYRPGLFTCMRDTATYFAHQVILERLHSQETSEPFAQGGLVEGRGDSQAPIENQTVRNLGDDLLQLYRNRQDTEGRYYISPVSVKRKVWWSIAIFQQAGQADIIQHISLAGLVDRPIQQTIQIICFVYVEYHSSNIYHLEKSFTTI